MVPRLRVAARVRCTEAEGPFRRFAVWVQGCTLRCPGCCNPELFSREGGEDVPVAELAAELRRAGADLRIEGLTVVGGEPLQQIGALTALCEAAAASGLGVIVFTGYRINKARRLPGFSRLWATLDTLVDGPFDPRSREDDASAAGRRFVGSTNQRLWHRTGRYADPALWQGPNHAELRIAPGGVLSVHGFPSAVEALARALG